MSDEQGDNGQGYGEDFGGAMTEWVYKYNLPQGEEPVAIAMVIGTKSGKIFVSPANDLLQSLSLTAAGIETISQVLRQRIQQSSIIKPKLILPDKVRYPKFGGNN